MRSPSRLTALLIYCLLPGSFIPMHAQPAIAWDKTLGYGDYEELQALVTVADGVVIAGSSHTVDNNGSPINLSWNFLMYKTGLGGNIQWQTLIGGAFDERLWSMIATKDGGFLAGGYSESNIGGNKSENSRGGRDYWIVKLDGQGQIQWDKTFGGSGHDELFSLVELNNGDFLLGGYSNSNADGDKTAPPKGEFDFWLVCCDNSGNKLWDQTIGGSGVDLLNDLKAAGDGNILLSGGTTSPPSSGDLGPEFARGSMDYWLISFNPNSRQINWQHRYGGTGEDFPYALAITLDGHLWLGGQSASAKAPPTAYNNGKDAEYFGGISDFWLLELNPNGTKIRDMAFGGDGQDGLYDLLAHECGGLLMGGVSSSDVTGNKTTPLRGGVDYWLIELDEQGNQAWQQSYGGAGDDALTVISAFKDGSYIFGGHSSSNIGFEKTEDAIGDNDFWVLHNECSLRGNIEAVGDPVSCANTPLTLDATIETCNDCFFLWNTGATAPTIQVLPGTNDTFSVKSCNTEHCVDHDTIPVDLGVIPQINIGPADTILFTGNSLVLATANDSLAYAWSTGSTAPSITVDQEGFYSVTVTNAFGCTASDAIAIAVKEQTGVYVPNVFSPNDDGENDEAGIVAGTSLKRIITFKIFDRWGNLFFEQNNFLPNALAGNWDGTARGKAAPVGVYAWFAILEYLDGSRETRKGSITIVR